MKGHSKYLDPELIRAIDRLDLKARILVGGFFSGLHKSPYHGFSVEFSEYKNYTWGDDLKYLDWGLYARTDNYYIRRYEAETNLTCHLVLDVSASMQFSYEDRMPKSEYAKILAAAMAYIEIRQRDAVGLITFADRIICCLKPRSRSSHLIEIFSRLEAEGHGKQTNFNAVCSLLENSAKRRGMVLVFSDFLGDPEIAVEALLRLTYRGHHVIAFQVLDPAELDFPFTSPVILEDPETGKQTPVDPPRARELYCQRMTEHQEKLTDGMRRNGIEFVSLRSSDSFDKALIPFLLNRGKLLKSSIRG